MLSPFHTTLLLLLAFLTSFHNGQAKELIATYEWQKIGPTDTLPAGLEIRMDLSGQGGKWARLPPKEIQPPNPTEEAVPHKKRCGPSCKERQKVRAEKRRASGFLLREPTHGRRQQEVDFDTDFHHGSTNSSWIQEAGIFLVGLTVGLGVATRVRRRSGEHES